MPWLSVSETSRTTPAGRSSKVTVLVDSTGLDAGSARGAPVHQHQRPRHPLVEVPVTVTVTDQTCDRTITGSYTRPVTVSSGLTCLAHGSVVTGPVTVEAGASLHATGASVVGPVRADGAARVELYESKSGRAGVPARWHDPGCADRQRHHRAGVARPQRHRADADRGLRQHAWSGRCGVPATSPCR